MALTCCPIIRGLGAGDCKMRIGGFTADEIYVANACEIDSVTFDPANPKLITAITMKTNPSAVPTAPYHWFQMYAEPNSGSFQETFNLPDTGNRYVTPTLSFQNASLDVNALLTMEAIATGTFVFLVNVNNQWMLIGYKKGLRASGATSIGAEAGQDGFAGINLEFTGYLTTTSNIVDAGVTIDVQDDATGTVSSVTL